MELWIFHQQRCEFHIFHGHSERNIANVPRCLLFGDPALLQHFKKMDLKGRTASFAVFWGSCIIFDDVSYPFDQPSKQTYTFHHLSLGMCWAQPQSTAPLRFLFEDGSNLGFTYPKQNFPAKTYHTLRVARSKVLHFACLTLGDWDHN